MTDRAIKGRSTAGATGRRRAASGERPESGDVERAVIAELEESPAQDSSLAAMALALARELDSPRNSATSKSMCAKALLDVLSDLRELAPPKAEETELDRRRRDREQRLAGLSAAGPAASS